MKKLVTIIIMVVMMVGMLATASANDDLIWRNVDDDWKVQNEDVYTMFISTPYGHDGFENNGYACYAGNDMFLNIPNNYSVYDIKHDLEEYLSKDYNLNTNVKVEIIGHDDEGRHVVYIEFTTDCDLRTISDTGTDEFENPVYGMKLVAYDRYYVE